MVDQSAASHPDPVARSDHASPREMSDEVQADLDQERELHALSRAHRFEPLDLDPIIEANLRGHLTRSDA